MSGISSKALSFGGKENSFKYNGKEQQKNEFGDGGSLDWYDYATRQYDNQIGRWGVIDPLGETSRRWSPYNFSLNSPLMFIDPDGRKAIPVNEDQSEFGGVMWGMTFRDLGNRDLGGHASNAYAQAAINHIMDLLGGPGTSESCDIFVLHVTPGSTPGTGGSSPKSCVADNTITPSMVAGYLAYSGIGYNVTASLSSDGKRWNYCFTTEKKLNSNNMVFGSISASKVEDALCGIGDGSSLYTTDAGLPVHTVDEWADHYSGLTNDQITSEKPMESRGWILKTKGGPLDDWRFVILRDYKVLDMRHVLVVGMKTFAGIKVGKTGGYAIEQLQRLAAPLSANKKQDYFSNNIGSQFLNYLYENSSLYNPKYSTVDYGNSQETYLSHYFLNFINTLR